MCCCFSCSYVTEKVVLMQSRTISDALMWGDHVTTHCLNTRLHFLSITLLLCFHSDNDCHSGIRLDSHRHLPCSTAHSFQWGKCLLFTQRGRAPRGAPLKQYSVVQKRKGRRGKKKSWMWLDFICNATLCHLVTGSVGQWSTCKGIPGGLSL